MYYTNYHGELFYVTATGNATYIHDIDNDSWSSWQHQNRLFDNDKLVFGCGNTLYLADSTEVKEAQALDLDVDYLYSNAFMVSVSGYDYHDEWTTYIGYDGLNFINPSN